MAEVHIDCPCPGTPHEQDSITLRDRLDSVSGLAIKYSVAAKVRELREAGQINSESGEITDEAVSWLLVAFINQRYLIYGVSSWTLVDKAGEPLRVTPENLRAFMDDHPAEAMQVGDQADDLYAEAVMLPLLKAAASSSQPGQTNGSISAMKPSTTESNGSSHSPKSSPKRSSPSSTASTTTIDTGPTSESSDGADSSSPSLASAGA